MDQAWKQFKTYAALIMVSHLRSADTNSDERRVISSQTFHRAVQRLGEELWPTFDALCDGAQAAAEITRRLAVDRVEDVSLRDLGHFTRHTT